jgi:hypothetical protein
MTQEIILWALLAELVGLFWVMVLAVLDDDRHTHDNRQRTPSPEHRDGYESRQHSHQQAKVAA